jgi:hypothetical protein
MALKMGMGRVMLASQFKMVHPAFQAEFPDHAPAAKFLQDAVHGNFIHPPAGPDGLYNFLSPKGAGGIPQNLQDRQTHRREPQTLLGQPPGKIAMIAHGNLVSENQPSCKYITGKEVEKRGGVSG